MSLRVCDIREGDAEHVAGLDKFALFVTQHVLVSPTPSRGDVGVFSIS